MDAPVPLILAALLAAGALVARAPRLRAGAMLGALILAPVILGFHIADSDQVKPLRDHPSLAAAGAVGAVVVLAVLALLFDGWPGGSEPRAGDRRERSSGRWPPPSPSTASSPATPPTSAMRWRTSSSSTSP